jgi:uncharacterized protein (TIRG00374 family)
MRLWLGLAISLIFLGLLITQFDLSGSLHRIAQAKPGWLILALVALCADFCLRISRWTQLLSHFNPTIRWGQAAGPFLGSFALNNVVPLRAGDIARAFAFTDELDIQSSRVTSSLVVERVLDLTALLFFLLISLILLRDNAGLNWVDTSTYVLLTLALAGVLLVLATPHWWQRLIELSPLRKTSVGLFIIDMLQGLEVYRGWLLWARLLALSLAAWTLEGLVFLFCCLSLSATPVPVGPWFAMAVGSLGTLLPSSPGYIGTFDYFAALALSSTGLEVAAATSATILVHLVLWAPITLAGAIYLLRHWGSSLGAHINKIRSGS